MAVFSPFSAYFDCSGSAKGKAPVLMVSGAVATLDKWLKFERDWVAVLDAHGLPNPFHMSEFMNAWGAKPDERDTILRKLAKVIRTRTRKTFSTGVVLADWKKVNERYQLAESLYHPFPLCAIQTLVKLDKWKARNDVQEPIERVFEDGDLHRDEFIALLKEFTDSPIPIFKTKKLVPLQLGDFVAWQNAKTIGRVRSGALEYWEDVPDTYMDLMGHENKDWGIFEEQQLIEYCDNHDVPKR